MIRVNKQEVLKLGVLINETQNLGKRIDGLTNAVRDLPCEAHTLAIKLIEQNRERNSANKKLNKKIKGNIKAHIYGGLIGAGATGLTLWLTYLQGLWG